MSFFVSILKHDLKYLYRNFFSFISIISFFVLSCLLFVFSFNHDAGELSLIGDSVIWTCLFLSSLMSLEKIFQLDYDDGTLKLLYIKNNAFEIVIMARMISIWVSSCLPLILITPAIYLFFSSEVAFDKLLSLSLTSLILTCLLIIVAALTLGIKSKSSLPALILFPLYIPIIILGINLIFPIICAILLIILPLSLFLSSKAVGFALDN